MPNDPGFPIKLQPSDLQDPSLSRLQRAFDYIWGYIQKFVGDNNPGHFLNGAGNYTGPVSASPPLHFDSAGSPGALAVDGLGNIYATYAENRWVRVGPSGTSTSF